MPWKCPFPDIAEQIYKAVFCKTIKAKKKYRPYTVDEKNASS